MTNNSHFDRICLIVLDSLGMGEEAIPPEVLFHDRKVESAIGKGP